MAGTVQPVQQLSDAGVAPTDLHTTIALQNEASLSEHVFLHVRANVTGPVNVTLVSQTSVDAMQVPNKVINIPASGEKIIGPIPSGPYRLSDGNFEFDVDVLANLEFFAIYATSV